MVDGGCSMVNADPASPNLRAEGYYSCSELGFFFTRKSIALEAAPVSV
jgi:hypothetical protein